MLVSLPLVLLASAAGARGTTLVSTQQRGGGQLNTIHVAGGV